MISAGTTVKTVLGSVDKTYIGGTHDATDLLHRVQIGAEASVHGEDLLVNDGGNG